MDQKHVLIRFYLEENYHRCWLRSSWKFKNHVMKILIWTLDLSVKEEPLVVPVWVSLEHLPLFLFSRRPFFSIGLLFGHPLNWILLCYLCPAHLLRVFVLRWICINLFRVVSGLVFLKEVFGSPSNMIVCRIIFLIAAPWVIKRRIMANT